MYPLILLVWIGMTSAAMHSTPPCGSVTLKGLLSDIMSTITHARPRESWPLRLYTSKLYSVTGSDQFEDVKIEMTHFLIEIRFSFRIKNVLMTSFPAAQFEVSLEYNTERASILRIQGSRELPLTQTVAFINRMLLTLGMKSADLVNTAHLYYGIGEHRVDKIQLIELRCINKQTSDWFSAIKTGSKRK